MSERAIPKAIPTVERAVVVDPANRPTVRVNGKPFESKASFSPRALAKSLRDAIAKRGAADDRT